MNRTNPVALIFTVIAWFCSASPLLAHMRLVYPEPRTSTDPIVQKNIQNGYIFRTPPCGDPDDIPVGPVSASFPAGSNLVVVIDILQTHVNQSVQVFVSYDDENFTELETATESLPDSTPYPIGGLIDPPMGLSSLAVQLPDQSAQRVTLRAFDNYAFFMCADIELQGNRQDEVFNDGFEK
jgi:hypothetical protein